MLKNTFKGFIAVSAVLFSITAFADFTSLPTSGNLRVTGSPVPEIDPMFVDYGPPISIDENGGSTYEFPTFLSLIAQQQSAVINPDSNVNVGKLYDYVFRDTRDNALVLGFRLTLNDGEGPGNNSGYFEINDLFRNGLTGFNTSVAWTYVTDYDNRIYTAAHTSAGFGQTDFYDADTIAFRSDINYMEGMPYTGIYLVKTNATEYYWAENAVRLRQGGEEETAYPLNIWMAGYTVAAPAAVPEPESYALMLSGLGLIGLIARRKQQS